MPCVLGMHLQGIDSPFLVWMAPRLQHALMAAATDFLTAILAWRLLGARAGWPTLLLSLSAWFHWHSLPRTLINSLETLCFAAALAVWPWHAHEPRAVAASRPAVRPGVVIAEGGPQTATGLVAGVASWSFSVATAQLWLSLFLGGLTCVARPTAALLWLPLGLDLTMRQPTFAGRVGVMFVAGVSVAAAFALGVTADSLAYGSVTVTPLNFFVFNLGQGLSRLYGLHAWWWGWAVGLPVVCGAAVPLIGAGARAAWTLGRHRSRQLAALSRRRQLQPSKPPHGNAPWALPVEVAPVVAVVVSVAGLSFSPHSEFRFYHSCLPLLLPYAGLWLASPLHADKLRPALPEPAPLDADASSRPDPPSAAGGEERPGLRHRQAGGVSSEEGAQGFAEHVNSAELAESLDSFESSASAAAGAARVVRQAPAVGAGLFPELRAGHLLPWLRGVPSVPLLCDAPCWADARQSLGRHGREDFPASEPATGREGLEDVWGEDALAGTGRERARAAGRRRPGQSRKPDLHASPLTSYTALLVTVAIHAVLGGVTTHMMKTGAVAAMAALRAEAWALASGLRASVMAPGLPMQVHVWGECHATPGLAAIHANVGFRYFDCSPDARLADELASAADGAGSTVEQGGSAASAFAKHPAETLRLLYGATTVERSPPLPPDRLAPTAENDDGASDRGQPEHWLSMLGAPLAGAAASRSSHAISTIRQGPSAPRVLGHLLGSTPALRLPSHAVIWSGALRRAQPLLAELGYVAIASAQHNPLRRLLMGRRVDESTTGAPVADEDSSMVWVLRHASWGAWAAERALVAGIPVGKLPL